MIAAGIFRGEGFVACRLRRTSNGGFTPFLYAGVEMCDRNSVEIVAKQWGTNVHPVAGDCDLGSRVGWRTIIGGNVKVREKLLDWISKGWLTGEKADNYFEAVAKCRRGRRVFVRREIFL